MQRRDELLRQIEFHQRGQHAAAGIARLGGAAPALNRHYQALRRLSRELQKLDSAAQQERA